MQQRAKILIVDDDANHRLMLKTVLADDAFDITLADNGESAVSQVEQQFFDLILMDLKMPGMDGIEAQSKIKELSPGIPIIMMTAYATVETAVASLKTGADDYLTKPVDIDELKTLVEKVLQKNRSAHDATTSQAPEDSRLGFSGIIGQSAAINELFDTLALVAPTDATVLILGESGTGKELIADAIHQHSSRREGSLIKLNCAALPESLLESELFGHQKGAFTGAAADRAGRFQQADGGALFLDEIAEMTPTTQAKILRVLQEKEFEPIGGGETVKVDVRIIAATNKDLPTEIEAGRFRQDLYYRLNVVVVTAPPLRHRGSDIALLADFFMHKYANKNQRLIKGIAPRALDLIMRHNWPGNVRELENVIERAVILCRGEMITPAQLPDSIQSLDADGTAQPIEGPVNLSPGRKLKDIEKEMIIRTLDLYEGNRTHASEALGISRRTLQLKLKEYGINK